jgi:hypothetical protein
MSLEYIRNYYCVPAKRGMKVTFFNESGIIVRSLGAYLKIRLDGERDSKPYRPMYELEYVGSTHIKSISFD